MSGDFAVVGLSHFSASVEVREVVATRPDESGRICRLIAEECGLEEVVVLSTCSRFEIYGALSDEKIEAVKAWLNRRAGRDLSSMVYVHHRRGAVRYLFRVAAGRDSWVVGETEILGQVKKAYVNACREGTAQRTSHLAFQRALNVGKRVRNETRIVGGIASIGGAAAVLARRIFTDLKDKSILVFGAGTMAESTTRHLCAKGVSGVCVSNRSLDNAKKLAQALGGTALTLEQGMDQLAEVDIAVFSTGASRYLLDADRAESISERRNGRPLFIIDIALPRNVAPGVTNAAGVFLYDLDDLEGIVKDSLGRRSGDLDKADEIVDSESVELWSRVVAPRMRPAAAGRAKKPVPA